MNYMLTGKHQKQPTLCNVLTLGKTVTYYGRVSILAQCVKLSPMGSCGFTFYPPRKGAEDGPNMWTPAPMWDRWAGLGFWFGSVPSV